MRLHFRRAGGGDAAACEAGIRLVGSVAFRLRAGACFNRQVSLPARAGTEPPSVRLQTTATSTPHHTAQVDGQCRWDQNNNTTTTTHRLPAFSRIGSTMPHGFNKVQK
eukprot:Hpha_TRINITY_DN35086_c0_g1::TRINITY_DN35086_c0_g1_i1::g.82668::m.82668